MGPEEMAAMQGQEQGDGGVTQLAQKIGGDLAKFAEILNSSQAVTDADREKMAMVMNGFIDLVENGLGQAGPGEDMSSEEPGPSEVPAVGGAAGVPMGPQTRQ